MSATKQAEYAKAVREHRLRKLRQVLNSQRERNVLLKRDYDARIKDITALEASASDDNWLESFKKLKVKIKGEKVVEQPKQIQYYNSSTVGVQLPLNGVRGVRKMSAARK